MPPRKRVKELEPGVDASGSTAESVKKKQSNAVGKRRLGNNGKLALLLEMPTEIFTEIACYMSPGDLLNLSRTSIAFRELLMSKSSKRVWEAARMVQNIPACPSDLCEPQYADLLFGKGCSFCSETRARKTHTVLRVRACKLCMEKHIIDVGALDQTKNYRTPAGTPISSLVPSTQFRSDKHGNRIIRKYIASQLIEVLERVKTLSSNPVELQAYVTDRKRITQAVFESKAPIEQWLHNASQQKERSNEELIKERIASIEARLRGLNYDDEDLDTRYDEKGWKWKHILNQTRPVSERVWQNIKPQLEETIQLRRVHAGPIFIADRPKKRLNEMRQQFYKFRPQLDHFPMGKLFLYADLLELPIVKELMEESDFKISLTNERWLLVTNALPDAVAELASMIEADCVGKIRDAALQASGIDELDSKQDLEADQDRIPACLLSATALFQRGTYGLLHAYTEMLRTRSISRYETYLGDWDGYLWATENFHSTGDIVTTASSLLEHLRLPKETTMAYMLACGSGFQCLRCTGNISGTWSMTWTQLVQHFIEKTKSFNILYRKNKERNYVVPLRNDHDLNDETVGAVVSRAPRTTVDMSPTGENADRYSALSTSWAEKTVNHSVLEVLGFSAEYESEDEQTSGTFMRLECPLCKKLDFTHIEFTERHARRHMRTRHGTDLEGNLLPGN